MTGEEFYQELPSPVSRAVLYTIAVLIGLTIVFSVTFPLDLPLEAGGKIVPSQVYQVESERTGKIQVVKKEAGDSIHAGELLAVLDPSDLKAELQSLAGRLLLAQEELRQARLSLAPDSHITILLTNVIALQTNIKRIQSDIEKSKIVSPVDGVVVDFIGQAGTTVVAGEKLVTIYPSDTHFAFETSIPAKDSRFLYEGLAARIFLNGYPTYSGYLEGAVESISVDTRASQQGELAYTVRIALGRKIGTEPRVLKYGLEGRIQLLIEQKTLSEVFLDSITKQ